MPLHSPAHSSRAARGSGGGCGHFRPTQATLAGATGGPLGASGLAGKLMGPAVSGSAGRARTQERRWRESPAVSFRVGVTFAGHVTWALASK